MSEEAIDWSIEFGPAYGEKGSTKIIECQPDVDFVGKMMLLIDTAQPYGSGTKITSVKIGDREQSGSLPLPGRTGGHALDWEKCDKGQSIKMSVTFIESCTFDATVFGEAIK